ncbi:MAG: type II CAAX endopeptidase family protein [Snowella sp.]|nr:type II CAAX endopeptidase family protein [Snowella sp.]
MTTKRLILSVLTVISLIPFFLSLINSLSEAQVQSNLELSQTNLLLEAAEIRNHLDSLEGSLSATQIQSLQQLLLGEKPYEIAQQQYESAQKAINKNLEQLKTNLSKLTQTVGLQQDGATDFKLVQANPAQEKIFKQAIAKETLNLEQLNLRLGLLKAQQENITAAQQDWQKLIELDLNNTKTVAIQETAAVLKDLWSKPPAIADNAEAILSQNLKGWFRYRALERLYTVTNQTQSQAALQQQEAQVASQSILKLLAISTLPLLGGIAGSLLLIVLFVQWGVKKDQAILAQQANTSWETPWNWEIIWQVLIVGFFFIGQIGLPLLLGLVQFDASSLTLRGKAYYVLGSYVAMTLSGLVVLYLSLKPFIPLPPDWFRFKLGDRALLWGIGGYLTALPLVVIVSLLNQLIWQGQGGSNPLLFLALEAQDKVVLAIFFFTACVAAPFFEELMFRGFLLPSLTRYVPVWQAIGLSSLLFAVAHLNLSEVLPLAMLGVILGVVYTRSRNLLSSMLLHSLWNSGTLISLFILGSSGS